MFIRILTLLEEMKETQRIQRRMLQTLLQQRSNTGTTVSSTPEGFPLKTVRDVEIMEEKLANPSFMSELVCMLSLANATQFSFIGGLVVNLIQNFPSVLTTMPVTVLSCCVVYSKTTMSNKNKFALCIDFVLP